MLNPKPAVKISQELNRIIPQFLRVQESGFLGSMEVGIKEENLNISSHNSRRIEVYIFWRNKPKISVQKKIMHSCKYEWRWQSPYKKESSKTNQNRLDVENLSLFFFSLGFSILLGCFQLSTEHGKLSLGNMIKPKVRT